MILQHRRAFKGAISSTVMVKAKRHKVTKKKKADQGTEKKSLEHRELRSSLNYSFIFIFGRNVEKGFLKSKSNTMHTTENSVREKLLFNTEIP